MSENQVAQFLYYLGCAGRVNKMSKVEIKIPVFDLQTHHSKVELPEDFDMRDLARKHHIFPLKVITQAGRKKLLLAMRNPYDDKALFDCEFRSGMTAVPVQADEMDIQWLIQTHYFGRKLSPTPRAVDENVSRDMFEQLEIATDAQNKPDWVFQRFDDLTDVEDREPKKS